MSTWVKIDRRIDNMRGLIPNAVRVYLHLSRRADNSNKCWPSIREIGDACFTGVSTNVEVRKRLAGLALDELEARGLLVKSAHHKPDGSQISNSYKLVTDDAILNQTPPAG